MEESEQLILQNEALNVLSLFPKRQIPQLTPNLQVYSKLFQSLTCTICRQIYSNPVYLKCSHRFCKDCIQKYIRSNSRKSCPNCRGGLTTKRDLRSDFNIQSLITFAFGDAKKMSRQLQQIEKLQYSQLQRQKLMQLRRAQSMTDLKNKPKENGQQPIVSTTSLKRTKTVDGQQVKRRRSQKKIKADTQKEKQPTSTRKTKQSQKNIKKEDPQVQIQVRKKKKSQVMFIEIESSDPVQVQEIPPQQFFQAGQNLAQDNKFTSLMCSISMIPQVSQIQSAKKITSMLQLQREDTIKPLQNNQNRIEQKMDIEEQQEILVEPITVTEEVTASCQALKQQFGNNFLNKIIQLTDYNIYMKLRLKKHPAQPFTPATTFFQIKIFAKITAGCISSIIADDLNINKEAIKLYVCQEHTNNYIQVNLVTKLQEINNRFWRSFGGFQIIQLSQKIMISSEDDLLGKYCSSWQNRILFYSVDYSKIIF